MIPNIFIHYALYEHLRRKRNHVVRVCLPLILKLDSFYDAALYAYLSLSAHSLYFTTVPHDCAAYLQGSLILASLIRCTSAFATISLLYILRTTIPLTLPQS
jgi:hypothetical protein